MKISYNWLKSYVPDIPAPAKLADLFTYHLCEVESVEEQAGGDYLFDLGVLPNRAHDLLSHQGVARELCGLLGVVFKDPTPMYKTPVSKPTKLTIDIQSPLCRRYSARTVRGIKVGPSPDWMVTHLESIGQRSINNIVDATNIVMFDCGQPTHAFDLKNIPSEKIIITHAKGGEVLDLVGSSNLSVTLKDTNLVVTNGTDILALAGVKGGAHSGITSETTDILIEVANFDSVSVRKTARGFGILSDSAKRFENDLSPELCSAAMFDLSALLVELFPSAVFEDVIDVYLEKQKERTVMFSGPMVANKLGITIANSEIETILNNYNFSFDREGDDFKLFVPPLRLDLVIPEDMVEEIGRIYGYDKVKPVLPEINFTPQANGTYEKIIQVRSHLLQDGYREVMTYSFTDKGEVEVLASASDKKFLRTNLTDGLKKSYELNKLNLPLLGDNEVKIFEIGTVFFKDREELHVAYANKKEIKEAQLEEFIASPEDRNSGPRGRSPDREFLSSGFVTPVFKMWSLYPFITRDIAVWVPEGTAPEKLKELYQDMGTELLVTEPKFFDSFTKEDRTSYAYRLIFQSYEKTLTDEEVSGIMANITDKIMSLGWEVR
jgi:phenylalanyl-tRNA synthetase beta chain